MDRITRHDVWTSPILVRTSRDKVTGRVNARGGGRWSSWKRDLSRIMASQPGPDVRFSTLFDLYGLPSDYPRRGEGLSRPTPVARVEFLEAAMRDALPDPRLIPYLQLHEFEAYVFVDLEALAGSWKRPTGGGSGG